MMQPIACTVTIATPPHTAWQTLIDVERWPAWASYMRRLRLTGDGSLALGSRVWIAPHGLPGTNWVVTEYDSPRSYTWTARLTPGLALIGGHVVAPHATRTKVTLSLATIGPLGSVLAPFFGVLFRRNTRLATEGLKRYLEQR